MRRTLGGQLHDAYKNDLLFDHVVEGNKGRLEHKPDHKVKSVTDTPAQQGHDTTTPRTNSTCHTNLGVVGRPIRCNNHAELVDVTGVKHLKELRKPLLWGACQGGHDGVLDDLSKVEDTIGHQGSQRDVYG